MIASLVRAVSGAFLFLATLTFPVEAADIIVIKGGRDAQASFLPHRDGEMMCRVAQPDGMSDAEWAAHRQVHLHGPVDVFDSIRMKQALSAIEIDDDVTAVTISICSPGGVYFEAPRMIEAIREYAAESGLTIITSAVGRGAWSAAAMVWLAGDILQIAKGASAVGFHAPYDPRDHEKADELVPEVRAFIDMHLARMEPRAFEPTEGGGEPRVLRKQPSFLASSINDYIDIAFDAKGAQAFLVIKSDFDVDLWEPDKFDAYLARWSDEYAGLAQEALVAGGAGTSTGAGRPASLAAISPDELPAAYARWYSRSLAHADAETALPVSAMPLDARYLRSAAAASVPSVVKGRAVVPVHALVGWEGAGLASPYAEWGETLFWAAENGEQATGLDEWMNAPVLRMPSFSNSVSPEVRALRAEVALLLTRLMQILDDTSRMDLIQCDGWEVGLSYYPAWEQEGRSLSLRENSNWAIWGGASGVPSDRSNFESLTFEPLKLTRLAVSTERLNTCGDKRVIVKCTRRDGSVFSFKVGHQDRAIFHELQGILEQLGGIVEKNPG